MSDRAYRKALVQWHGMAQAGKIWTKHQTYHDVLAFLRQDVDDEKEAKRLYEATLAIANTPATRKDGGIILG